MYCLFFGLRESKCDMIKGNESDVGNVDFELKARRGFWIERIVHISATRCLIEMGVWLKCSILNGQVIYIKNQNWILPTCDSFPLIVLQM